MSQTPASTVSIVLTTLGADADATTIARTLVDERLAACVNILPPMTSVYRWQGKVEQDREQQMVIKTASDRVPICRHGSASCIPTSSLRCRGLLALVDDATPLTLARLDAPVFSSLAPSRRANPVDRPPHP